MRCSAPCSREILRRVPDSLHLFALWVLSSLLLGALYLCIPNARRCEHLCGWSAAVWRWALVWATCFLFRSTLTKRYAVPEG
jgi:hypothetical protein